MTANGANPTTWVGTTTPNGSRRLKMYTVENMQTQEVKSLSLIPAPKTATVGEGEFVLNEGFTIAVGKFTNSDEQSQVLADVVRLITTINEATGLDCKASDGQADIMIEENAELAPEGYVMDITEGGVSIQASTADGVYYAMQSFMRLLPPNVILGKRGNGSTVYALPVSRIEDEPRFAYRGFMLDVSRHFFTIEQVKKMIDLMAIWAYPPRVTHRYGARQHNGPHPSSPPAYSRTDHTCDPSGHLRQSSILGHSPQCV